MNLDSGNALELVLSIVWMLCGCVLPQVWQKAISKSIVEKDESDVFLVINNAVVYDFLLNKPLVDPPTVPSKLFGDR